MGIIKTVGRSGQISLGKKFAGQTIMLDEIQAGVWILKLGRFIPDNEKWLNAPDVQAELNEARPLHNPRKDNRRLRFPGRICFVPSPGCLDNIIQALKYRSPSQFFLNLI